MSHGGMFEKFIGTLGTAVESVLENHEAPAASMKPTVSGPGQPGEQLIRAASGRIGDAIDQVLAGASRSTASASLRDSEVANAFRDELSNGLIRADTVNRLLQIVDEVLRKLI